MLHDLFGWFYWAWGNLDFLGFMYVQPSVLGLLAGVGITGFSFFIVARWGDSVAQWGRVVYKFIRHFRGISNHIRITVLGKVRVSYASYRINSNGNDEPNPRDISTKKFSKGKNGVIDFELMPFYDEIGLIIKLPSRYKLQFFISGPTFNWEEEITEDHYCQYKIKMKRYSGEWRKLFARHSYHESKFLEIPIKVVTRSHGIGGWDEFYKKEVGLCPKSPELLAMRGEFAAKRPNPGRIHPDSPLKILYD